MLMLIYAEHTESSRLSYILHELFVRRLGISYETTNDINSFHSYTGPKINYSYTPVEGSIHINPHTLLFETELNNHILTGKHNDEWDTLMLEQNAAIPFDIFAASFYLLSRYEEYLPHKVDEHGRFDPEQSLAVQYGFIETPLIDKWAIKLKEELEKRFGPIPTNPPTYRFISTFDIDTAYLYKGLEYARQLKKTIKSATLFRFARLAQQVQVLHRHLQDPYDTYAYIDEITKGLRPIYFVLCGGDSEYDEAIPLETPEMQDLLSHLQPFHPMGIHFSYETYNNSSLMGHEKMALEQVLNKKCTLNRQHFLRFRLPQTMNLLISNGITEDYSMGYSDVCGFRASTAHPFAFFDLETNTASSLLLYPTSIMDVTLRFGMNLTISSAINKSEQLIQEIKQVNGCCVTIWHNSNLSHTNDWFAWREVFEKLHSLAR
jgi:hypothetical protein